LKDKWMMIMGIKTNAKCVHEWQRRLKNEWMEEKLSINYLWCYDVRKQKKSGP